MSRRGGRGPRALPEDLDALGRALERAAGHQLARRRLMIRLAQGLAIVMVAVPCALAVWATELGSGTGTGRFSELSAPGPAATTYQPTTQPSDVAVEDDGESRASRPGPCPDGYACTAARSQSVFVTEDRR